jgi:hypothetical protein
MQKINSPRVACFDVDETILFWTHRDDMPHTVEFVGFQGEILSYCYDAKMVAKIRSFKECGYTVIVWSQSGEDWAEKVIEALKLQESVDFIMTKPQFYIDDLPADAWMKHIKSAGAKNG